MTEGLPSTVSLPPLPIHDHAFVDIEGEDPDILVWRAGKMRAYAQAAISAVASERDALAVRVRELEAELSKLIDYASGQLCTHEETHRGGAIWEICDWCGAKWADDKGGKPKWKEPKQIIDARAALTTPESKP